MSIAKKKNAASAAFFAYSNPLKASDGVS
jgi:hypothetical protein